MSRSLPRKTAPGVRRGRVQKKNRHAPTPNYWNTPQSALIIDRRRPGRGYRHLLRKRHITDFACIVPEWQRLAEGLDAVVLARGDPYVEGWYQHGVVGISAWDEQIVQRLPLEHAEAHADLFDRLEIARARASKGMVFCHFTASTARAYQLLHVFLHELGHHCDRMSDRGEPFAEEWAYRYEKLVWERYLETFGLEW